MMKFGYARVFAEKPNPQWEKLVEVVGDDRFVFADRRTKEYERKNYLFLRNMLRSGDTLYVDGLDSLGSTLEEIAEEWRSLTKDLQVDVVVLCSWIAEDFGSWAIRDNCWNSRCWICCAMWQSCSAASSWSSSGQAAQQDRAAKNLADRR